LIWTSFFNLSGIIISFLGGADFFFGWLDSVFGELDSGALEVEELEVEELYAEVLVSIGLEVAVAAVVLLLTGAGELYTRVLVVVEGLVVVGSEVVGYVGR
jgi:hypothetical protein